ncbi:MAG: ABC transporter ATP-binding protein [candidate division KSB1 bacterium]|nr:ABC transporter ATP-binding protein [candidate division KSB1 bacterium]MDZ7347205.1 ABC transporter ATP-binding protein [candidate division KSB1 bacterium]
MQKILQLVGVSKSYPSAGGAIQVLQNLDWEVEAGDSVAVVGPSGSGKSTLLNLIGGLDRPDSGRIELNGRNLAALSEDELARVRNREIGFVFQLHHLLPQLTVLENVLLPVLAFGADSEVESRARTLLERVGLAERQNHFPAQLSGGELQRAAVVRALINRPRVLLADEPTGSLDAVSAASLADLILELNHDQGVALIVVTHSLELAERMRRRFRLSGGRLLAA